MADELTPMMKQFRDIKTQYPDAMLLFRCGDFYETYAEDAIKAAKILNITLTHRSNGGSSAAQPLEMAGFPFHALDTYLPKLVRAGLRVAICDQLEDPKLTKKLVKRGVTELVTPGVSYSDTTLTQKENNWVACLHFDKHIIGVAFLDISTGEFLAGQGDSDYIDKLLTNFAPKEVLYVRGRKADIENLFGGKYFTFELEDWMLVESTAKERLQKLWGVSSLKGFGLEKMPAGVTAAGGILMYLDMTQHLQTGHIQHLSRIEEDKYVWLDRFTIRNLELMRGQTEDSATLYDIIDRTITPMGGRLLHRWMAFPLKDVRPIRNRQTVVEHLFKQPEAREALREALNQVGDLERIVSKVSTGRIGPREMVQLGRALKAVKPIKDVCERSTCLNLGVCRGYDLRTGDGDDAREVALAVENAADNDYVLCVGSPNDLAFVDGLEVVDLNAYVTSRVWTFYSHLLDAIDGGNGGACSSTYINLAFAKLCKSSETSLEVVLLTLDNDVKVWCEGSGVESGHEDVAWLQGRIGENAVGTLCEERPYATIEHSLLDLIDSCCLGINDRQFSTGALAIV